MRLTGSQARVIAEISDGAEVVVSNRKGEKHVVVHRVEDGLRVRVDANGNATTITEPGDEDA